jgi:hypothetical protein
LRLPLLVLVLLLLLSIPLLLLLHLLLLLLLHGHRQGYGSALTALRRLAIRASRAFLPSRIRPMHTRRAFSASGCAPAAPPACFVPAED